MHDYEAAVRCIRAVADPRRLACLDMIDQGHDGPAAVYRELQSRDETLTLQATAYHIRLLAKNEMIEETREPTRVRGFVARHYAPTRRGKTVLEMARSLECDE